MSIFSLVPQRWWCLRVTCSYSCTHSKQTSELAVFESKCSCYFPHPALPVHAHVQRGVLPAPRSVRHLPREESHDRWAPDGAAPEGAGVRVEPGGPGGARRGGGRGLPGVVAALGKGKLARWFLRRINWFVCNLLNMREPTISIFIYRMQLVA